VEANREEEDEEEVTSSREAERREKPLNKAISLWSFFLVSNEHRTPEDT
jgi:hypothetical protein